MNLAKSIQVVTEDIVMRMACHAREATGEKNLCLAGGVALNCVANGKLATDGPFENIWIQPAAGDAGRHRQPVGVRVDGEGPLGHCDG